MEKDKQNEIYQEEMIRIKAHEDHDNTLRQKRIEQVFENMKYQFKIAQIIIPPILIIGFPIVLVYKSVLGISDAVNMMIGFCAILTLFISVKWRHDDNNKVIIDTYIKCMDEFMFLVIKNNGNIPIIIKELKLDTLNINGKEFKDEIELQNFYIPHGEEINFELPIAYIDNKIAEEKRGITCKGVIEYKDKSKSRYKREYINIRQQDTSALLNRYSDPVYLQFKTMQEIKGIKENIDDLNSIFYTGDKPKIKVVIKNEKYYIPCKDIYEYRLVNEMKKLKTKYYKEHKNIRVDDIWGKDGCYKLILGVYEHKDIYNSLREDNVKTIYINNKKYKVIGYTKIKPEYGMVPFTWKVKLELNKDEYKK